MSDEVKHNCQVPDGALVVGVVELAIYVTPDGRQGAMYRRAGDSNYSEMVGWLSWVKADLVSEWQRAWPDVQTTEDE